VQLFQSPTITGQLLVRSFNVIVVALVVDLISVWARTIIDGKPAAIPTRARGHGPDPSARLATLLLRVAFDEHGIRFADRNVKVEVRGKPANQLGRPGTFHCTNCPKSFTNSL
jgi:hypothetical protein